MTPINNWAPVLCTSWSFWTVFKASPWREPHWWLVPVQTLCQWQFNSCWLSRKCLSGTASQQCPDHPWKPQVSVVSVWIPLVFSEERQMDFCKRFMYANWFFQWSPNCGPLHNNKATWAKFNTFCSAPQPPTFQADLQRNLHWAAAPTACCLVQEIVYRSIDSNLDH